MSINLIAARLAEATALIQIAREKYPLDIDLQAAERCIEYAADHAGIKPDQHSASAKAFYVVYTKEES